MTMPKPDWNQRQNPGQKSKDHGKHDATHGAHEHGMGAQRDPDHEHGPKQEPDDLTIIEPDDGEELAGVSGEPLAGTTSYPSTFFIGNVPPVTDQGTTPRCVAHSNGYDTNQQDRPELGRFNNLDEALFFQQIGGTSNGAYMTAGLNRRRDYGYPEAINVPASGGYPAQDGNRDTGTHRIAGYTQIALTVSAIKAALKLGHGVLVIGDWYHSWFHPFASGKLPAPDYKVGGHARWYRGWNDSYGFRMRNSWGTDWGIAGDCYEPYAYLSRLYAAYRTTDK
jgi:C1A family cysteine protease